MQLWSLQYFNTSIISTIVTKRGCIISYYDFDFGAKFGTPRPHIYMISEMSWAEERRSVCKKGLRGAWGGGHARGGGGAAMITDLWKNEKVKGRTFAYTYEVPLFSKRHLLSLMYAVCVNVGSNVLQTENKQFMTVHK